MAKGRGMEKGEVGPTGEEGVAEVDALARVCVAAGEERHGAISALGWPSGESGVQGSHPDPGARSERFGKGASIHLPGVIRLEGRRVSFLRLPYQMTAVGW